MAARAAKAPAATIAFAAIPRLPRGLGLLLLGQRPLELAVTVELDLAARIVDLADDVHHVAAADHSGGLDLAVLAERRLEVALVPALLLEDALDGLAGHRDLDVHLVGRAL